MGILDKHEEQAVIEQRKLERKHDPSDALVDKLVTTFSTFSPEANYIDEHKFYNHLREAIGTALVTKPFIQRCSEAIIPLSSDEVYFKYGLSPFVRSLIQTAYEQGENDFVIDPGLWPVRPWYGFTHFQGSAENPLKLTFPEYTGHTRVSGTHIDAIIHGDGMPTELDFAKVRVKGDCLQGTGYRSYNSEIETLGSLQKDSFSEASHTTIKIHGSVFPTIGRGAHECTFKAKTKKDLEAVSLNKHPLQGLKYILFDDHGNETEIRF